VSGRRIGIEAGVLIGDAIGEACGLKQDPAWYSQAVLGVETAKYSRATSKKKPRFPGLSYYGSDGGQTHVRHRIEIRRRQQ
jgi:hypothetical protein